MESNKNSTWIILFLLLIIAAGSVYFFTQKGTEQTPIEPQPQAEISEETPASNPEVTESEVSNAPVEENKTEESLSGPSDLAANLNGTIEGGLSYPSEGLPEDLEVCAINLEDQKLTCTKDRLKGAQFQYGEGFAIKVPAGDYQVYSATSKLPGVKAYYSEYVKCGEKVGCRSHEPITVKVEANKKVTDVNPWDWFPN